MLAAATALDDAERKVVTALGYASTLGAGEQSDLIERLTEEAQRLRAASKMINQWLDGAA